MKETYPRYDAIGVKCGGWGHIVMEIRVEDRKNV
jgi:hypothetical protein